MKLLKPSRILHSLQRLTDPLGAVPMADFQSADHRSPEGSDLALGNAFLPTCLPSCLPSCLS